SVVIGYDCRFAGQLFAETAARVFCAEGIKVYMGDKFASTPMVSLGAFELKAGHGVVITASHNPASYNGYKLKANYGGPAIASMVTAVEERIPELQALPAESAADYVAEGLIEYIDLEEMYFQQIKAGFDLQAIYDSNIRVAYDAMYGAGQSVFPRILPSASLLHCEFNPSFNGQAPEPLHRNLGELSALIAGDEGIKLGIANDGDADRIGMYDGSGNFVDSHHVILLLVHYLHHYKKMTGKVVIAFSVTDRVKKLCEHYGLTCQVTEIGFKHICEIMVKEDVLLGGEESGGIAIKGFIPERDGIWIGLTLLEFMAKTGKSLEELIEEVYEIVGAFVFERNDLKLDNDLKLQIVENCKNNMYTSFGEYDVKRVETIDGHKFHLANEAWVMIRPSGTEPVLRVYAEAGSQAEVDAILAATKATLLG
ncbi:hypothetical protein N8482_02825, partial [Chitinophagales bacterium]|nr:hypothetical protein [Chitinophagales bacterium]